MGYSQWSNEDFQARQDYRRANRQTAFTYDHYVRQSGKTEVHPQMDPFGVLRESRDSQEHPTSLALGVVFDVTGSMGSVPRVLQSKLGKLMHMLVTRGYVAHPQVLFGGIGDAHCDHVPVQFGQFESGLEMDEDLGKIYLEGGGGGQVHESYELAMYFFAAHTAIDCFERRGRKGYLFTIGDEKPYRSVSRAQARHHFGDRLKQDLPLDYVLKELQRRYHCFHIIPTNTSHGRSADVHDEWRSHMGERVLLLEDEGAVCETIALAVGLNEGAVSDLHTGIDDLVNAGNSRDTAQVAANALQIFLSRRRR